MKEKVWSPYLAGSLAGALAVLSVLFTGNFFGASTTFVRSSAMLEKIFAPERVANMDYFLKYAPKFDWQFLFVLGIFIGALISSLLSGNFKFQAVPDMWKARFGPSKVKRAITAFLGGGIALFGARLAGGCPSGHGLSGVMQASVSGYIALTAFFLGGVVVARMLYRGGRRK